MTWPKCQHERLAEALVPKRSKVQAIAIGDGIAGAEPFRDATGEEPLGVDHAVQLLGRSLSEPPVQFERMLPAQLGEVAAKTAPGGHRDPHDVCPVASG